MQHLGTYSPLFDEEPQKPKKKLPTSEERKKMEDRYPLFHEIATALISDLPKSQEKRGKEWLSKIEGLQKTDQWHLRNDYIKLLILCLQRQKLVGIFSLYPEDKIDVPPLPEGLNIQQIAKGMLEVFGAKGDGPKVIADISSDLTSYAAVQEIPGYGVHSFFAVSKEEPLTKWLNNEKLFVPYPLSAITLKDDAGLKEDEKRKYERKDTRTESEKYAHKVIEAEVFHESFESEYGKQSLDLEVSMEDMAMVEEWLKETEKVAAAALQQSQEESECEFSLNSMTEEEMAAVKEYLREQGMSSYADYLSNPSAHGSHIMTEKELDDVERRFRKIKERTYKPERRFSAIPPGLREPDMYSYANNKCVITEEELADIKRRFMEIKERVCRPKTPRISGISPPTRSPQSPETDFSGESVYSNEWLRPEVRQPRRRTKHNTYCDLGDLTPQESIEPEFEHHSSLYERILDETHGEESSDEELYEKGQNIFKPVLPSPPMPSRWSDNESNNRSTSKNDFSEMPKQNPYEYPFIECSTAKDILIESYFPEKFESRLHIYEEEFRRARESSERLEQYLEKERERKTTSTSSTSENIQEKSGSAMGKRLTKHSVPKKIGLTKKIPAEEAKHLSSPRRAPAASSRQDRITAHSYTHSIHEHISSFIPEENAEAISNQSRTPEIIRTGTPTDKTVDPTRYSSLSPSRPPLSPQGEHTFSPIMQCDDDFDPQLPQMELEQSVMDPVGLYSLSPSSPRTQINSESGLESSYTSRKSPYMESTPQASPKTPVSPRIFDSGRTQSIAHGSPQSHTSSPKSPGFSPIPAYNRHSFQQSNLSPTTHFEAPIHSTFIESFNSPEQTSHSDWSGLTIYSDPETTPPPIQLPQWFDFNSMPHQDSFTRNQFVEVPIEPKDVGNITFVPHNLEVAQRNQTFDIASQNAEESMSVFPPAVDHTYEVPCTLDHTYEIPPPAVDRTYEVPCTLDHTYEVPPSAADRTYEVPCTLNHTYDVPPTAVDRTYEVPCIQNHTYEVPPPAVDRTYEVPCTLNHTYDVPPTAVDRTFEVPCTLNHTYEVPPALGNTFEVPSCALDHTHEVSPTALDHTYEGSPIALDRTFVASSPHNSSRRSSASPSAALNCTYETNCPHHSPRRSSGTPSAALNYTYEATSPHYSPRRSSVSPSAALNGTYETNCPHHSPRRSSVSPSAALNCTYETNCPHHSPRRTLGTPSAALNCTYETNCPHHSPRRSLGTPSAALNCTYEAASPRTSLLSGPSESTFFYPSFRDSMGRTFEGSPTGRFNSQSMADESSVSGWLGMSTRSEDLPSYIDLPLVDFEAFPPQDPRIAQEFESRADDSNARFMLEDSENFDFSGVTAECQDDGEFESADEYFSYPANNF